MKAARLYQFNEPLKIEEVAPRQVKSGEVLVKVTGAYVCTSDLDIISGHIPGIKLPLTPGHNNAGYVEQVGQDVPDFKKGDAVAVFGGWGCGSCRFCRQGEEQLCSLTRWVGFGVDGGYAEYLHVPSYRHLIKLDKLEPVEAAPLIDVGLTPYRAIRSTLPHLYAGSAAVIIGVGNIGYFAVQIMKAISPGANIIAVDVRDERLKLASQLGADWVIDGRGKAADEIKRITGGEGAQAVIDTVCSDDTLGLASAAVGRKAIIMLLGLAGGILPYSFLALPAECVLANSVWGTYNELKEVLALAAMGKIKADIKRFPLKDINDVFSGMRKGRIEGQAVITP
jgi:propanol-preferring alcohol dehydrogenase